MDNRLQKIKEDMKNDEDYFYSGRYSYDWDWLIEQAEKVQWIEEESDKIILKKTDRILNLEEENEQLKADLLQWKKWYEQATGFPATKS